MMNFKLYKADDLHKFVLDILVSSGVKAETAKFVATGLWSATIRGTDSHGIRLLPHYIAALKGGRINPDPNFRFNQTSPTTGILDADHTFGQAAGIVAIKHAINLAEEAGTGFIAVKNSTHCGAMAYYALEASKNDMIGLAFTHATPKVRSFGSNRTFFGTNPICFTAPMLDEDPFCYDSAPTFITSNKVKLFREEGKKLPDGYAADKNGRATLDPFEAEMLLPIGGYKGFGLSMVVDILCSLLSGMPSGNEVSKMYGNSLSEKRNLGQFYGAININKFVDPEEFKKNLKQVAERLRLEPKAGEEPVMVPGDPEKKCEIERLKNGIPISDLLIEKLNEISDRFNIDRLKEIG